MTATGPQALSPRLRTLWHVGWGIAAAVIVMTSAGVAAVGVAEGLPLLVVGAVVAAVAMVVAAVVVPRLRYDRWRWELTDDALDVSHGVLTRVESSIPVFRVQQIDVRQGPVERWFGIVSLHIATASAASDGVLPGIDTDRAEAIRAQLLARVALDDGV
jgi:membrane protein YdbS with pleckstrin-like domain